MTEKQSARARLWAAAQSDSDLLAVLEENSRLRAENADLRVERARLREANEARNIEAAIARGQQMRAHRPRDLRGLLALVRDAMNKGRTGA